MKRRSAGIGAALLSLSLAAPLLAQDIEPRRWTPLPVGLNFLGAAVVHSEGDITFDPVLELEDVTVESQTAVLSYLRSFELLNRSARFDVRLPLQNARWKGLLSGQPASTERTGMGDPRLRLSVNLAGAPPLAGRAFQRYRAAHPVNTVVGAALAVTLPLGEYKQDKLLNLGGNRYVFQSQLGFVHTRDRWSCELTGSVFLYTDNDDFLGVNKREQDPLYALQAHLTYTSPQQWWVSAGAGYDLGGETRINGVRQDDERRDLLFGASAGLPLSPRSSIKLAYIGSRTQEDTGQDTDSIVFSYLIRF